MLTPEMVDHLMNVNLDTVNVQTLADISTLELDPFLPKDERMARVLDGLGNPFCFRCGDMGIHLEFDDDAPPLAEVLAGFLLRKKSGL